MQRFAAAFHPASVVTFLRDPVDRVVSSWRHHVRAGRFAGPLEAFIEQPGEINVQSQFLQGADLRDLGFVGLSERMPEMVAALSRHLGVALAARRDNVGREGPSPQVGPAVRARILALNEEDVHLYRHVEANHASFTDLAGRPRISAMLGHGRVYAKPDGLLFGWALARDPGQLGEIEVRVGDRVVGRAYADQFVPWLKKRTPHGVGGFQVRLPADLVPGAGSGAAPIRVVIAGTGKDLKGSPIAL
jgi:hypothetical protein